MSMSATEGRRPETPNRQTRIEQALKEHDARLACHLAETQTRFLDLMDAQSPAVLTALLDYLRQLPPTTNDARAELRQALVTYFTAMRAKAQRREDELYRGITGEP
jgi:hypothetical protein